MQQKKDSNRTAKVSSFIQQILGQIIQMHFGPSEGLVTISKVETSRDMRWAKVWISIFGGDDKKILERINRNIYSIQGEMNEKFSSKIVPRLQFFLDTSPRYVEHIEELVKQIHESEKPTQKKKRKLHGTRI